MNIIKKLTKYYFWMLTLFFIGRVSLFILYFDKFSKSDANYWLTFIYGARMDTMISFMLLVIPLILLTLAPKKLTSLVDGFLKYYFLIVFSILIYIENASFPFGFYYLFELSV